MAEARVPTIFDYLAAVRRGVPLDEKRVAPLPASSHFFDPPTSREAEAAVTDSGQRVTHAERVLDAVRTRPGLCAAHYGELTGLGRVEAARRLSDLKALGHVVRCDDDTWRPVAEQPRLL